MEFTAALARSMQMCMLYKEYITKKTLKSFDKARR